MLAEWTGLEPATPGVTGRYSNQLNYHSIFTSFATIQTRSAQPIISIICSNPSADRTGKRCTGRFDQHPASLAPQPFAQSGTKYTTKHRMMRNFLMRRSKGGFLGERAGGIPPGCEANHRLHQLRR